jgi:hypothetical protein
MSKEIDTLLKILAESFSESWTEAVEELFTMLLEVKAGVRS